MPAALKGNLDDFGIAEIFQLIGHQRKTGILDVHGPKNHVRAAFDQGALAWAEPVGETGSWWTGQPAGCAGQAGRISDLAKA